MTAALPAELGHAAEHASARNPMSAGGLVHIGSILQAIDWGDSWVKAYREERRARLRELHKLEEENFWLRHRVAVLEGMLLVASLPPLEEAPHV